jgi:hypothetical protein
VSESDELHPALRWSIEAMVERGRRQRMLRERRRLALARPKARAEWDLADQLRDLHAASIHEWADALVDVAELNGLDPTDAPALIALRNELLEALSAERLGEFTGLLAVTDEVIERACASIRPAD